MKSSSSQLESSKGFFSGKTPSLQAGKLSDQPESLKSIEIYGISWKSITSYVNREFLENRRNGSQLESSKGFFGGRTPFLQAGKLSDQPESLKCMEI